MPFFFQSRWFFFQHFRHAEHSSHTQHFHSLYLPCFILGIQKRGNQELTAHEKFDLRLKPVIRHTAWGRPWCRIPCSRISIQLLWTTFRSSLFSCRPLPTSCSGVSVIWDNLGEAPCGEHYSPVYFMVLPLKRAKERLWDYVEFAYVS